MAEPRTMTMAKPRRWRSLASSEGFFFAPPETDFVSWPDAEFGAAFVIDPLIHDRGLNVCHARWVAGYAFSNARMPFRFYPVMAT